MIVFKIQYILRQQHSLYKIYWINLSPEFYMHDNMLENEWMDGFLGNITHDKQPDELANLQTD